MQKDSPTNAKQDQQVAEVVEFLTGSDPLLVGVSLQGRNIWGRVAFRDRTGAVHVEVLPKDKQANDAAMSVFTKEEMELDSKARYKLYRLRCCSAAQALNQQAMNENGYILLVSANGHLTRAAKTLLRALSHAHAD